MVLSGRLWILLSAFSPTAVTEAVSRCFHLQCSLCIFLSPLPHFRGLQRAARVVPDVLMLWTMARTLVNILLLKSLGSLPELF